MNPETWTAIAGVTTGAVIGIASVVYARRAAKHAGVSANAAQRSADEAAALTRIEAERRADERQKRHDELRPADPGEFNPKLKGRVGNKALFATITLGRAYRVAAESWDGTGTTPIGLPLLLPANRPLDICIESWTSGQTTPRTREVRFRFWPPIGGLDQVDAWSCPCDGPTGETTDSPGHWELIVPVVWKQSRVRGF